MLPDAPLVYPAFCNVLSPTINKWVKLTAVDVAVLRRVRGYEGQNIFFHLNHPIRFVYLCGLVVSITILEKVVLLAIDDSSGATIELKLDRLVHKDLNPQIEQVNHHVPPEAAQCVDTCSDFTQEDEQSSPDTIQSQHKGNFTKCGASGKSIIIQQVSDTSVENLKTVNGHDDGLHNDLHVEVDGKCVDVGTVLKAKGTLQTWHGAYQLKLLRTSVVGTVEEERRIWFEYAAFAEAVLSHPWFLESKKIAALEYDNERRACKDLEEKRRIAKHKSAREQKRKGLQEKVARYEEKAQRRRARESEQLNGCPLTGL